MNVKERKVFALKNFRGLDKENKPLKVEPFRASDGYNFVINSETLKTRKAFKFESSEDVISALNSIADSFVIDFYSYYDFTIYITNNGFCFFNKNTKVASNSLGQGEASVMQNFAPFNFENKKPLFVEDKDCLFIFGLGGIFVFSVMTNGITNIIAFYELANKPANPFDVSNEFFEIYEGLPTPYEPTLFIGLNKLDDVNLLSNVSKYRLFSENKETNDGYTSHILPTHYKADKNRNFSSKVEFYKNRFSGIEVFPIFLGISGENFISSNIQSDFGSYLNLGTEIEVKDIFYPDRDIEFSRNGGVDTKITEIYNLKKEVFFKLTIKTTGQTVFEDLLSYIKLNPTVFDDDKVMIYDLVCKGNVIYRDSTTNNIIETKTESFIKKVYVQIKKWAFDNVDISKEQSVFNASIAQNFSDPYPDFPSIGGTFDKTVLLNSLPILTNNISSQSFETLAVNFLKTNSGSLNLQENDRVLVNGQLYNTQSIDSSYAFEMYNPNLWLKSPIKDNLNDQSFDYNDSSTYEAFPVYIPSVGEELMSFSGGHPIITQTTEGFNYSDINLSEVIRNNLSSMTNFSGVGYAKIYIRTSFKTFFNVWIYRQQSLIVFFTYSKDGTFEVEIRRSFSGAFVYADAQRSILQDLYTLSLSDDSTHFIFKVKDIFFDYNNEPSIDVKITFQENPDYKLISDCGFGISFGSENRLFLAGHPDFKNIDRFNVSNDLLGNNKKNQSYELTYFPSKNFRVLGGKGAINGYVIATDSQLCITKEDYPNDSKLFIRNRVMNDNGIVGYNEFKTSFAKSPLNNRCLVRFYNDILILSKDGLFALELSNNVLTDERLIRLRSGFINKELVNKISNFDISKIFILENNNELYIFIGKDVFVADSRYVSQNPNSIIENLSYEIVQWNIPVEMKTGRFEEDLLLLDHEGKNLYHLENSDSDDFGVVRKMFGISHNVINGATFFQLSQIYNYIFDNPENIIFYLYGGYRKIAIAGEGNDYHYIQEGDGVIYIDNAYAFRNIVDGDTLYCIGDDEISSFVVSGLQESNRESFNIPTDIIGNKLLAMWESVRMTPLYISKWFVSPYNSLINQFLLTPYKPENVENVIRIEGETDEEYISRITGNVPDYLEYNSFLTNMADFIFKFEEKIPFYWLSSITDFGNNIMEKTMFRSNIYATKLTDSNTLHFGFKTMRRIKTLEDGTLINVDRRVDLANTFDFSGIDFNTFSVNTFNEFGLSIPTKENNFLYIQFVLKGQGRIELNSIEVLYKLNRLLKSVS